MIYFECHITKSHSKWTTTSKKIIFNANVFIYNYLIKKTKKKKKTTKNPLNNFIKKNDLKKQPI